VRLTLGGTLLQETIVNPCFHFPVSPLSVTASFTMVLFRSLCFSFFFSQFSLPIRYTLSFASQALPNQQTVDYPSFKLVIVGDGGTGESPLPSFR